MDWVFIERLILIIIIIINSKILLTKLKLASYSKIAIFMHSNE